MTTKLAVISSGLSAPSSTRLLADRLAESVERHLRDLGETVAVETVELREIAAEIANNLVTGFPGPRLRSAQDTVVGADGLVAVTPVFSASYSGLFKSFFDVLDNDALTDMPVLIGATGGTARHSLVLDHAMRPLFSYLRAVVAPTGVYAAAEDWGGSGDELTDTLPVRIDRAGSELASLMSANAGSSKDMPSGEVVPFAQQLKALRRHDR